MPEGCEEQQASANPDKMAWWVCKVLGSRGLSSLILDGVALPGVQPEGSPNSQLLLKEQVAVVARTAFTQLCVVRQLLLFLNCEALRSVTHMPIISRLDYCNALYMELLLKSF